MNLFRASSATALATGIAMLTFPLPVSAEAQNSTDEGNHASVEIVTLEESGEMMTKSEYDTYGYSEGTLTNGILSVYTQNCETVTVDYHKSGGSQVQAQLGYVSGLNTATGPTETMTTGDRINEVWTDRGFSSEVTGSLTVPGDRTFYTPSVPCD